MQRNGQLHHTQAGSQMPARDRYGIDGLAAQLVGNLNQVLLAQPAQIGRATNLIKQRSLTRPRRVGHETSR
jgi:hypothetical protein